MPGFTRSFLFPDINVWIALTYDGHVHHRRARTWFEPLASSARVFFCRFTQLGLLRLLTSEAVMGCEDVMDQNGAWDAYDRWIQDERVGFLDEPSGLDAQFRAISRRLREPAPKDWADSYLASFADASDFTIVSFDQAFQTKARSVLLLKP
jgi:toxin-antitoxin system PIN domain toxin